MAMEVSFDYKGIDDFIELDAKSDKWMNLMILFTLNYQK